MKQTFGRSARRDLKRPLFWLGLVLPVCFVAGVTGATIPTQLPLLSIVLPFVLWRSSRCGVGHWLGITFLVYAALSLLWAINPIDSVFGLWQVVLWALAFCLGSSTESLSPLWRGMAIGLAVSSMVAVAQSFGWTSIPSREYPAGLLYSGSVQAAMIALAMVALCCDRDWLYIPLMLPGLWFAHSRAGVVILFAGLLARVHWAMAVAAILATAAISLSSMSMSDVERLQIWSVAAHHLTLFGSGIGSFIDVLYQAPGAAIVHPEYVHNDYLQLAFELGIGAIPMYLIIARTLSHRHERYWPVFVGFATLSLFYFSLYCASLAFIGAVAAGHILRRDDVAWRACVRWRLAVMAWSRRYWREAFPLPSRNTTATIGAVDAAL